MIWSDSLLDGVLKYLLFSPQMGEMIQVDEHSFQIDRDLQLLQLTPWKIHRSTGDILKSPAHHNLNSFSPLSNHPS